MCTVSGNRLKGSAAQLVFCDLSTRRVTVAFNVYDDLKQKLMEKASRGRNRLYPRCQHRSQKEGAVRKGALRQVRILMGSTQKMGAGTNVQDRLMWHSMIWTARGGPLILRSGWAVSSGKVTEPGGGDFHYVTEGTFDAYLYQLVENKQKFIAQIMTSKSPVRVADDVDETALNYSEIKALATGNPLIIEKCNLDMEVGKLNMLKASHLSQKYALEEMVLKKYPKMIQDLKQRILGYEQDAHLAGLHPKPKEGFAGITLMGKELADKEAAGKAS
jgi:hypothetical protein